MDINDVVVLKMDLPNENLKKGALGVVVSIFEVPELAYGVEFCSDSGETLAEVSTNPCQIEIHSSSECG